MAIICVLSYSSSRTTVTQDDMYAKTVSLNPPHEGSGHFNSTAKAGKFPGPVSSNSHANYSGIVYYSQAFPMPPMDILNEEWLECGAVYTWPIIATFKPETLLLTSLREKVNWRRRLAVAWSARWTRRV